MFLHKVKGNVMNIRDFRHKHRISGMKLATILGIDRQTVYNWGNGKGNPPKFLELALIELDRQLSPKTDKAEKRPALKNDYRGCKVCFIPYDHTTQQNCPNCERLKK